MFVSSLPTVDSRPPGLVNHRSHKSLEGFRIGLALVIVMLGVYSVLFILQAPLADYDNVMDQSRYLTLSTGKHHHDNIKDSTGPSLQMVDSAEPSIDGLRPRKVQSVTFRAFWLPNHDFDLQTAVIDAFVEKGKSHDQPKQPKVRVHKTTQEKAVARHRRLGEDLDDKDHDDIKYYAEPGYGFEDDDGIADEPWEDIRVIGDDDLDVTDREYYQFSYSQDFQDENYDDDDDDDLNIIVSDDKNPSTSHEPSPIAVERHWRYLRRQESGSPSESQRTGADAVTTSSKSLQYPKDIRQLQQEELGDATSPPTESTVSPAIRILLPTTLVSISVVVITCAVLIVIVDRRERRRQEDFANSIKSTVPDETTVDSADKRDGSDTKASIAFTGKSGYQQRSPPDPEGTTRMSLSDNHIHVTSTDMTDMSDDNDEEAIKRMVSRMSSSFSNGLMGIDEIINITNVEFVESDHPTLMGDGLSSSDSLTSGVYHQSSVHSSSLSPTPTEEFGAESRDAVGSGLGEGVCLRDNEEAYGVTEISREGLPVYQKTTASNRHLVLSDSQNEVLTKDGGAKIVVSSCSSLPVTTSPLWSSTSSNHDEESKETYPATAVEV